MPHLLTRLPRLAALVAMAALAVAVMAGPASAKSKAPQPRESRTYLGTVAGSDAFAAIVVRRGVATAYVCDSKEIASWLRGTFKNGKLRLKAKDGATLEGTLKKSEFTPAGGEPLKVKTHFSPVDDKEHFFTGSGEDDSGRLVGGWITLKNGRQRGAVRTSAGEIIAVADRITARTKSITLATGAVLGIVDYLKNWEELPQKATDGGAL